MHEQANKPKAESLVGDSH